MSMGIPQIVSDCPAQARVVERASAGLIHKAGDPQDLAEKLLEMHEYPDKARQLGMKAEEAIREEWDWRMQKQGLLSLYQNI